MQARPRNPKTLFSQRNGLFVGVLALYAALLVRDISLPWVGMHDWNGAFYSYSSYNIVRYPISVSRLLPVVEMGATPPPPEQTVRYATHPPGLAWLLAISFVVFGYAEWSARLVPILSSVATLALLMYVIRRARGPAWAVVAGMLYVMMPMNAFFGRMVNHEPVCQFFMLLAWCGWTAARADWMSRSMPVPTDEARTIAKPTRLSGMAWHGGMGLAIWVDWPGVLAAGVIAIDAARTAWIIHRANRAANRPGTLIRRMAGAAPAAAIVWPAFVTLANLAWLVHGGLGGSYIALRDMFFSRSSIPAVASAAMSDEDRRDVSTRGKSRWNYTVENVSPGVLACAAIGLVLGVARRLRARGPTPSWTYDELSGLAVYFALVGGAWLVLFWPQFLKHNYWQYYLGIPIALAAANGIMSVASMAAPRNRICRSTIPVLALLVIAVPAWSGINDYFARRSQPMEFINAWRAIAARLLPADEVLVTFKVEAREQRGAYSYRNLHTPQLAYYLDRRCVSLGDPTARSRGTSAFGIVLARDDRGATNAALIDRLRREYPAYIGRGFVLLDLHPERGTDWGEFGVRIGAAAPR